MRTSWEEVALRPAQLALDALDDVEQAIERAPMAEEVRRELLDLLGDRRAEARQDDEDLTAGLRGPTPDGEEPEEAQP